MAEQLTQTVEQGLGDGVVDLGRMTVLEVLAEETSAISADRSHRSTQMGNGVDAEDD